ncbi:tyrosine-type recombinase/integrase [Croceimicrobium hydrocarbonivorans]|uniref:Tyrosine-type recombinase/integrase n=1 Tax=Croceimicrobium hydrocarbonivorans TaxID=2761580 RepID=A0A7H0VD42_9FLAO|nr:tyrosine-type recombinase/integrase [Croceimicrobium hydrocarbonivorans]QNR23640.1 tyrosine-type recombinase/integrase [Croceimicrobium hydrocarbonivorans]
MNHTKIRADRTQIVIRYSFRKIQFRHPTGIKIDPKKASRYNKLFDKNNFPVELQEYIPAIHKHQKMIEDIIQSHIIQKGEKPYPAYVTEQLQKSRGGNNTLIGYFDQFLKVKEEIYKSGTYSITTYKDFVSLSNALKDFEDEQNRQFKISHLDKTFILSFYDFLRLPRPFTARTRGKLATKTVKKRFDSLKAFYKWLEEEGEVIGYKEFVITVNKTINFKRAAATEKKTDRYALDRNGVDELKKAIDLPTLTSKQKEALEIFLFQCLTGTPYGDLKRIGKEQLHKVGDKIHLVRGRGKSGVDINLPLATTAHHIFKKYDYDLDRQRNELLNKNIKAALAKTEFFRETEMFTEKPRYKRISSHTGRRTFVSRLLNEFNLPFAKVMKMTGHKKIDTLMKYLDFSRDAFDTDQL